MDSSGSGSQGCGEKKISIFVHTIAPGSGLVNRIPGEDLVYSRLYKLEMEANRYQNPSQPIFDYRPMCSGEKVYGPAPLKIDPIWSFKGYPYGMSCVRVGTYLYFFGGSLNPCRSNTLSYFPDRVNFSEKELQKQRDDDFESYPRDVHVFDCNTCQLITRNKGDVHPPWMTTGKSINSFSFVDEETKKIYVLSSTSLLPSQLCMFEVFDPETGTWTPLPDPPPSTTSYKANFPCGSALVGTVIFVSFASSCRRIVYIHSYDIPHRKWTVSSYDLYPPLTFVPHVNKPLKKISMPAFQRNSIVINNALYSSSPAHNLFRPSLYRFPVLCYSSINLTSLDLPPIDPGTFSPIFPKDTFSWPIYNGRMYGSTTSSLVHLGGLLYGTNKDTACFGYVEVFNKETTGVGYVDFSNHRKACYKEQFDDCIIRFVAFEVSDHNFTGYVADQHLPANNGPFFRARNLHASHFCSSVGFENCRLANVFAIRS